MTEKIREEERETEDQMARRKLGPRGVPGEPDSARMTPQRKKKLPESGEFDGHTASTISRTGDYETGRVSSAASLA
jgi:hypothetical protein